MGAASISQRSTAELEERISSMYRDYLSVFEPRMVDTLPGHHSFDHAIDLQEDAKPLGSPLYALSQKELSTLHEYLDEMPQTGKI